MFQELATEKVELTLIIKVSVEPLNDGIFNDNPRHMVIPYPIESEVVKVIVLILGGYSREKRWLAIKEMKRKHQNAFKYLT